jgi:hypothetical protein
MPRLSAHFAHKDDLMRYRHTHWPVRRHALCRDLLQMRGLLVTVLPKRFTVRVDANPRRGLQAQIATAFALRDEHRESSQGWCN